MPEPYRLWLRCKDLGHLWYDGGISAQPHVMMLEFDVCRAAVSRFAESQSMMRSSMQQQQQQLEALRGGVQ